MDQAGARIPAWKKLGLKLRSGDQSGDAVPDVHSRQTDPHQPVEPAAGAQGNGGSVNLALDPAETSKTARLAKRKPDGPAEGDGQTPKKSKKSKKHQDAEPSRGEAVDIVVTATKEENAIPDHVPAPEAGHSGALQPKGDPNYRKKKGKPNKKQKPQAAAPDDVHLKPERQTAHQKPRTPSLSPGQADSLHDGSLLASTETPIPTSHPFSTPQRAHNHPGRRKSVTFTPDTKTEDGTSAGNLFKKWVQEQKGLSDDVEETFSMAEVSKFVPPPKSHPANGAPAPQAAATKDDNSTATKGKKKDPALYQAYLNQYHTDRANWKFNKAKQNDVLDNSLNIFRIPEKFDDALFEYVKGLKGAGIIARQRERCYVALKELDEMDDPKDRAAAKQEALQERLAQEKKRRQADADIEDLANHPNPAGHILRLKRRRIQSLLLALDMAMPIQPVHQQQPSTIEPAIQQKMVRKRKKRSEVSSDESSSDSSSSEEPSSSESESESGSEAESKSGSEAESSDSNDSSSSNDSDSDSNDASSDDSD